MREARREGDRIEVRFSYDASIVERMRRAGGRWDSVGRLWAFAASQEAALLSAIDGAGFVLIGVGSAPAAVSTEPEGGMRVRDLVARATDAVRRLFPDDLWVLAELSGVERAYARNRDALYFELIDRDGERSAATVAAWMQGDARLLVERRLREVGLAPVDGLRVRLRGRVEMWTRGALAFRISDLDPTWSLGELALRREQVLRAIAAEGLERAQIDRTMPTVPLRVALVTSDGSDAYHDIVKTLAASRRPFVVSVFDCRVQGAELERTVLRALSQINAHRDEHDVVLVSRGGGGRAELSQWDSLSIARAIALLPIKVIVAIGHERDQSALDAIALSARTPTAAAELLVRHVEGAAQAVELAAARLADLATLPVGEARESVVALAQAIKQVVGRRTAVERTRLSQAPRIVRGTLEARRRAANERLARCERRASAPNVARRTVAMRAALESRRARLAIIAARAAVTARNELRAARTALGRDGARVLERAGAALAIAELRRKAGDPARILARGFGVVRNAAGQALRSVDAVEVGERLRIELHSGMLDARVEGSVPQKGQKNNGAAE
jgi:exodeoxyribonuclease VII large subunit